MASRNWTLISWAKLLITVLALAHIGYLASGLFSATLDPNPVEVITHQTGEWGLHFLLLTLLVTPLRRHFGWNKLQQLRRFLGLWSFAYLFLHFFTFILFDHSLYLPSIIEDVFERPYITVGFLGLMLLVPLAVTSLKWWQKRLGKRWVALHRTVYLVGILGIVHYWWLVKADILWPAIYALVLVLLLADRLYWRYQKR